MKYKINISMQKEYQMNMSYGCQYRECCTYTNLGGGEEE